METGLRSLRELAPFSRECLMPAPEKNFAIPGAQVRDWLRSSESRHGIARLEELLGGPPGERQGSRGLPPAVAVVRPIRHGPQRDPLGEQETSQ